MPWIQLCGFRIPGLEGIPAPFTARGFERVPSLLHLQGWLTELMTI
jgi:hypothetical protein